MTGALPAGNGAFLIELSGTKHNKTVGIRGGGISIDSTVSKTIIMQQLTKEAACFDLQIIVHILYTFIAIDNVNI
jgi:hypothetical protein